MTARAVLVIMSVGLAALCAPAAMQKEARGRVRMVFNASDSLPRGWYRIDRVESASALRVGSIVLARAPDDVAAFAARRGYLPQGVPLLKRIGAVAPQSVCVRQQMVRIDGVVVAALRTHDGAHRLLQAWPQCRDLAADELFLLGDANPASFDSRYFGPIRASSVLGVAQPFWTWRAP